MSLPRGFRLTPELLRAFKEGDRAKKITRDLCDSVQAELDGIVDRPQTEAELEIRGIIGAVRNALNTADETCMPTTPSS